MLVIQSQSLGGFTMKGLKWALCFALVAAFLWAAGTASAHTEKTTMAMKFTSTPPTVVGWDNKCADLGPQGQAYFVTTYFDGADDCGGHFTFAWSFCTTMASHFLVATHQTFEITYREGGTITGTMEDMEVTKTGNRCVLVPVPPLEFEITGGTADFAGCTGDGNGVYYLDSSSCGGNRMQIMSLDAKIKFPQGGRCPNDSDETSE
jgi:hypothetical protein